MLLYVYLLGIFIFFSHVHAAQLVINTDSDTWQQKLHQKLPQSFLLETLTYSADVYFEKDEFLYLTDLHEGRTVTTYNLERALFYLIQKNKFKKIIIRTQDGIQGLHIHFDLIGYWTFAQLKIKGILVGKDTYRQYYLMERGDSFSNIKHEHSLTKIKQALKNEGYFLNHVESSLSYDKDTKSVNVIVAIDAKNRFSVGSIDLLLYVDSSSNQVDQVSLKKTLHKNFLDRLQGKSYTKITLSQVAQAIKKFLARRGFLHVTIELKETIDKKNKIIHLHWIINLHNKRTFVFLGNQFFSHNKLLDYILQFGRSAWLLPASILAEEIMRAYHNKGFWQVKIDTKEEGGQYFFIIKEGTRARVQSIKINNTNHIAPGRLIKRCCRKLLQRKYFDADLLQQTFDAIVALYKKKGFLDARIVNHNLTPLNSEDGYVLVIGLEEGVSRKIKKITVQGFPDLELQGPFRSKNEQPLTMDMIQKQRAWLLEYFQNLGYALVVATPNIQYDDQGDALVDWHIKTGHKNYFGKTVIQGTSTFPFNYVMRELQYKAGDVWNQKKIRSSFVKLKDLEIFDAIHIRPSYQQAESDEKPVLVKLHKDDRYEMRVRGGFGLQQIYQYKTFAGLTYKAGGTFIIKNLTNRGDQLRLNLDFMRSHRELVLKYCCPWLFRLPIRTELQAYGIQHEQPGFVGSDHNIYCVKQKGFLVNFRRVRPHNNFGCNVGFEWMETTMCDSARELALQMARAINFTPTLLGKTIPFLFVEPTLLLDYLDNSLNPTRGSFSLFSLKGMFPIQQHISNSYFVRLLIEQSFFASLRAVVGALRFRFGHIFFRDFSSIMPTERFYLGGAHSVRSYDTDYAPPLGTYVDKECKRRVVPRGGKTMVNLNLELRMPLVRSKMGGVIFQDLGVLSSDNFADFRREHLLAATGFGLRFYTPVGPIRFDIGWKWRVIKPIERSYAWFLTLGQAF